MRFVFGLRSIQPVPSSSLSVIASVSFPCFACSFVVPTFDAPKFAGLPVDEFAPSGECVVFVATLCGDTVVHQWPSSVVRICTQIGLRVDVFGRLLVILRVREWSDCGECLGCGGGGLRPGRDPCSNQHSTAMTWPYVGSHVFVPLATANG